MSPLYLILGSIPERGMSVAMARMVMTATMAMKTPAAPMVIAGFLLEDKLRKVRSFQETF